jgi:heavy metal translocating P-type ATPase
MGPRAASDRQRRHPVGAGADGGDGVEAVGPVAPRPAPRGDTSDAKAAAFADGFCDGFRQVLVVDGMFCAACAASVESALARVPGVAEAAVNFAADAAVVRWAPRMPPAPELLFDTVAKLGYSARLAGAAGGSGRDGASPAGGPGRDLAMRLVLAVFFGMWTMLPSIALYLDATSDPVAAYRLAIAAGLLAAPVILYSGLPFYRMGVATLRAGVAGIDALVTLGVAGSVVISLASLLRGSAEVYFEVPVALITLQLVARLIDWRLRRSARDAVVALLDAAGSRVTVEDVDGHRRSVALADVATGDRVRILAGQRVPVDGRVEAGAATLDRSLLTGEAAPVPVTAPDGVHAGEQVLDGSVLVVAEGVAGGRRIDALARQVRSLLAEKPPWQRAADLVARYFLWLTLPLAGLALGLGLMVGAGVTAAAARALAVLVIACPCALSLAVPLVALAASGAAARAGVVLRDLNVITGAARPTCLFVDKTGTLTGGRPAVTAVHPVPGHSTGSVLRAAAAAERDSGHPLAHAIVAAAEEQGVTPEGIHADAKEGRCRVTPGGGVALQRAGETLRVGSRRWLESLGLRVEITAPATAATRVFVACDDRLLGAIDLDDPPRPGVRATLERLRAGGLVPVVLSGDGEAPVRRLADALGLDARASCAPEDKVAVIREARARGDIVAFVGDGINDSTALAAADLGVAVGGATDAARAASAVTLVDGDIAVLPRLLVLLDRSRRA